MSKKEVANIQRVLKTLGHHAFIDYLTEETDGFIHAWDQYIYDAAGEYIQTWLTNHPYIKITEEFVGCGNCAVCAAIRDGKKSTLPDLLDAFNTEAVMQSVTAQLEERAVKQPVKNNIPKTNALVSKTKSAYVFKVTLNYSKPLIWRRIIVPENYTFYELHCAIQDAMGWLDSHLHSFTFDTSSKNEGSTKSKADSRQTISLPHPDMFDVSDKDESEELIAGWFGPLGKQCIYTYDFGDGWDHTVILEKIIPVDAKQNYPQCIAGKNACPPEDCGGAWGYENLKAIIADPKHPEHTDMLDWLGLDSLVDFNPADFKPQKVEFDDPKVRLQEWRDQIS